MSDETKVKKAKKEKRKAEDEVPVESTPEETDKEKKKKAKKAKKESDAEAPAAAATEGKGESKESKGEKKERRPRPKGGISIIANPLAGEKMTKKVLKLVKKAAAAKSLRRGVKEVQKALRKNESGLMILAGNITPIDVITHLPVLCEEKNIPYIYVPYKEDLGEAGGTKRPTSVILITGKGDAEFLESYKEVVAEVKTLTPVFAK